MAVRTPEKRLWLRRRWSECTPGGGTLYATLILALQASAFSAADAVKAGSISSVARGDASTSFSNSDHGSTSQDMAELGGEMLDLYADSDAALIASGVGSPTDAQRFAEMLDRLKPVREFTKTFSGLRVA